MCARQEQELAIEKNDRVESVPLDVYGLENLTAVTKINLPAHYVCVLIMSDPWLCVDMKKQGSLLTQIITQSHVVQMTNIGRMDL